MTAGADSFEERLAAWSPSAWEVASDWRDLVAPFFASDGGQQLGAFVRSRLADGAVVFPPRPLQALALTPLHSVKVVVLGQDPYHGPGQAHGLAFSVAPGLRPPPSLVNIRTEIAREREAGLLAPSRQDPAAVPLTGDLTRWACEGVLLLNTCLSVEQARPGSHVGRGWELLTQALIGAVNRKSGPIVFMLWGAHAQSRRPAAGTEPQGVPRLHLLANHPSPLSARRKPVPFIGCGHFAQTNDFLVQHGQSPVDW